eukprot:15458582-Alexandrium_andersonii.AAC.1
MVCFALQSSVQGCHGCTNTTAGISAFIATLRCHAQKYASGSPAILGCSAAMAFCPSWVKLPSAVPKRLVLLSGCAEGFRAPM